MNCLLCERLLKIKEIQEAPAYMKDEKLRFFVQCLHCTKLYSLGKTCPSCAKNGKPELHNHISVATPEEESEQRIQERFVE